MGEGAFGVKGFAVDNKTKTLAIITNRNKVLSENAPIQTGAFVDPQSKDILKLTEKIADDGNVQIYSTLKKETLEVFTNLHMFTTDKAATTNPSTTTDEESSESNDTIGWVYGIGKSNDINGLSTA